MTFESIYTLSVSTTYIHSLHIGQNILCNSAKYNEEKGAAKPSEISQQSLLVLTMTMTMLDNPFLITHGGNEKESNFVSSNFLGKGEKEIIQGENENDGKMCK